MEGAPSAVDLFDPKPELDKNDGKQIAIDVFNGNPGPLMKSPFTFKQYGESGAWVCEKYPNVAQHVDDIAFVKSCYTESNDHVPALYQMNTGIAAAGLPDRRRVDHLRPGQREPEPARASSCSGTTQGVKGGPLQLERRLPAHRPTRGRCSAPQGSPILNLKRPEDVDRRRPAGAARPAGQAQRRAPAPARRASPTCSARIEIVRAGLPHADGGGRPGRLLAGDRPRRSSCTAWTTTQSRSFGGKCLMARRLVERGVRFVQVYSDGEWDAHTDLAGNHTGHCAATDVPIDGLLTDLKRRGLFDSTLVIWGGEFGRMPVSQGNDGRDHNPHGLPRLDGRRRHQGRREPRRDRRDRLPGRRRPASPSTTCTPRCCTCSASTTSG